MSKLICETCGQYEHQGECDMPKQAQVSAPEVEYGKLQERIKELEEQNEYLKEVLISPIEADHCIKALKSYWKGEECICVTSALAKLQAIIEGAI